MREGAYDYLVKPLDRSAHAAPPIVGESRVMRELSRQLAQIRSSDTAAYMLGEGGAGKEVIGHRHGASTGAHDTNRGRFEQASGGTLFLDEVGETHPPPQVKVLCVLQDGVVRRVGGTKELPVEARIVSATTRDLEAEAQAGSFWCVQAHDPAGGNIDAAAKQLGIGRATTYGGLAREPTSAIETVSKEAP